MIPSAGTTCKFAFKTNFSALDGVYTIISQTTFQNAVAAGIDFLANLYTPAGLSPENYNADYSGFLQDRVAVIQAVSDNSIVYYIPESILRLVPDPTIKEYYDMIIVVKAGAYENTQVILPTIDAITDTVRASLGVTDPAYVVTNTANKVYLTDSEYSALEAARQANIETLVPLSVQLQQARDDNTLLAAKIAAYEALIAQLSGH